MHQVKTELLRIYQVSFLKSSKFIKRRCISVYQQSVDVATCLPTEPSMLAAASLSASPCLLTLPVSTLQCLTYLCSCATLLSARLPSFASHLSPSHIIRYMSEMAFDVPHSVSPVEAKVDLHTNCMLTKGP